MQWDGDIGQKAKKQSFIDKKMEEFDEKFPEVRGSESFEENGDGEMEAYCGEIKDEVEEFLKDSLTKLSQQWKECVPKEKDDAWHGEGNRDDYNDGFNSCRESILEEAEEKGLL